MVYIPNIITDNIAKVCGIPELVTDDFANGLKIEHIWMEQYNKAHRTSIGVPCLIVIHSNQWVRACITPDEDNIHIGFPVIDISDIVDEVLPTLEEDYVFPLPRGLRDGNSLSLTYQSLSVFRSHKISGGGVNPDFKTLQFIKAVDNILSIIRNRINDPLGKYHVGTTENLTTDLLKGLSRHHIKVLVDRLKVIEESNPIRQQQLPPSAVSSVFRLTDYHTIRNYGILFDHSGLFDSACEDNPLEYIFEYKLMGTSEELNQPIYEPYRGHFIFMKTRHWFRGMRYTYHYQDSVSTDLSHLQVDIKGTVFDAATIKNEHTPVNVQLGLIDRYKHKSKSISWKPENRMLLTFLAPVQKWIETIKSDEQKRTSL